MSDPVPADHWQPLSVLERRVLGVMVEKQKTSKSADAYPLTLNALTTGCNQKSNRDPVLELSDDDVEETIGRLQGRGLVTKITGGRADRFKHLLYEAWRASKLEMAVLAELLLRGPQSEGDLRGRASRMDEIKDLDELRTILKGLADRKLVVYLTPPDRRGAALTHGFHTPAELEAAKAAFAGGGSFEPVPSRPSQSAEPGLKEMLSAALQDIAALKAEVAELRERVTLLASRGPSGPG